MNKNDAFYAAICGLAIAWVATDFFGRYGWVFFIVLPVLSVVGLWLADLIGRKLLFVHQAGKYALSGAFADVIDIKVFQILFWLAPFSLFFKGVSFLIATSIKYWSNKHWTFEKHEMQNMHKEIAQFFMVTLVGLAIDVISFYYFKKLSTGISAQLWVELSIIIAALAASVWNFLGYKFIVFKK